MNTPILNSDRLLLRPFDKNDVEDVYNGWESDPEIAKYMFWTSHNDINKTKEWINFELGQIENDNWYRFALVIKETGELIGTGLIYYEDEVECWEIGYNLGQKYWGKGYATEAMKRIMLFAKDDLHINQIVGRYAKENPASGNIMIKLGFQIEKEIPYECNNGTIMREGFQCRYWNKKYFKVAVLQKSSLGRLIKENTAIVVNEMKRAAKLNTDILLIPECYITGYELPITNLEALDDSSIYLQSICNAAKEYKIGIVATALTKGIKKPQNSAFVIGKDGSILMKYSKVHTCDFADEACLESGNNFSVCDFDGVKLGIMICYDREYPESARVLMMKGAEIILVPNDCCAMTPRIQALSTRAYENMVGVVMANPPGENAGQSCAFSPICWDENGVCIDNTIFVGSDKSEKMYVAEFDLEKLRDYRSHEMMGNTFRKVKAYSELLNEQIKEPFIR